MGLSWVGDLVGYGDLAGLNWSGQDIWLVWQSGWAGLGLLVIGCVGDFVVFDIQVGCIFGWLDIWLDWRLADLFG